MKTWPFGILRPFHYGAIYADPPWSFENWSPAGEGRNAKHHYACMTLDDLKALPVGHLASRNCALFMWFLGEMMQEALDVCRAWGFRPVTIAFDWTKVDARGRPAMGLGYTSRKTNEHCLLAVTGDLIRKDAGVPQGLIAPRREHSRKPDEFYRRIERLYDGPYLELFARQRQPGWDAWGNETDKFEEVA